MIVIRGYRSCHNHSYETQRGHPLSQMEELIEFQIQNCTDAIGVAGTTGETACLDMQEHFDLIKFTCEVVDKRIPVIAGSGSNNTRRSKCTCGKRGKW